MRLLRLLAMRIPQTVGSPWAFLVAIVLVAAWIVWGFSVRWSNTWLLWPSAIASVVTFLIAFSLQYTQNRDTRAIQLKLDEILRASRGARTELTKVEQRSDADLTNAEQDVLAMRDAKHDQDGRHPTSEPSARSG